MYQGSVAYCASNLASMVAGSVDSDEDLLEEVDVARVMQLVEVRLDRVVEDHRAAAADDRLARGRS